MSERHPRIARETRTMEAMIRLYCSKQHESRDGHGQCDECEALADYARSRLARCRYQEGKTTCAQCPTHCYKPAMCERIRAVMRYAGPRMLYRHPVLTIRHLIDGLRKQPVLSDTEKSRARGV
jgi:hypothetical protein